MQEEGKDDKGNSKKKSGIRGVGRLFFCRPSRGADENEMGANFCFPTKKNGKSRGEKYGFPVFQVR